MTTVPALAAAARDVLSMLDAAGRPACLIGGLVVLRWGQPRATTDADLSVLTPIGEEPAVIDLLLSRFQPRRPDARTFALNYRVLLLLSDDAVKIDVALAALPFEIEAIEEATPWDIVPSVVVRTCSAEHLIVYKLVAGRPQDLLDMETVVRRQGARLNLVRIRRWAGEFAEIKEDPDLLRPFEMAVRKAGL